LILFRNGTNIVSEMISKPSRFLASAALARLALRAARHKEQPQNVRIWISYLPRATFVDEADLFGRAQEFLEATPDGWPQANEESIVLGAQQAIGTRVERLLSNLAFEAAVRKEKTFPVTVGEQFTKPVNEGLLKSLPIPISEMAPVLARLVEELRIAAHEQSLKGDWGSLREESQGLVLEIAGPLERLPVDRPRARIVGGMAKDR
jgi:hypothetical protein